MGLKSKCPGLEALEIMKRFRGFGSLSMWFWKLKYTKLEPKFWVCEFWMLKGSETHENGNSKKRWVFEYLHMHTLAILFVVDLVVGFICLLFKFHGISEAIHILGLERVVIHLYLSRFYVVHCYIIMLAVLWS